MNDDRATIDIHCDWSMHGLRRLLSSSDAIIIVDVLSFTTCVDIATARGATVVPHRFDQESGARLARTLGARLAGPRGAAEHSLSPASLTGIDAGLHLVLPSPNGSALSVESAGVPTFAGCLRNAGAVTSAAIECGSRIGIVAAGERWPDGMLRPCLEDWLGAGALVERLNGHTAPNAAAARAAFRDAERPLARLLGRTQSGRELIERGFEYDVELAAELDVSTAVPRLLPWAPEGDARTTGWPGDHGNPPLAYVDVSGSRTRS